MGLYMIDNLYASEMLGTGGIDGTESGRATKKRRVDSGLEDTQPSGNIMSTLFGGPTNAAVAAAKKKSGIGYDGAVKEDVSIPLQRFCFP